MKGENVFFKLWNLLRTYILTIPRFDLFLQGALLIIVLLQSNVNLLLRRDADTGVVPALIENWVFIGTALIEFLCGAFLGWLGKTWRHFALAGWLSITAAASLLVLAFPYDTPSPAPVELCGDNTVSTLLELSTHTVSTGRVVMLVITAVLCSLTMISIWAHGLTYLDDHEPQNGPYFYGILISIRLSLGLNGQGWLRPGSSRDDWWEAHLSLSMLTFMFAVLFTLFPRRMPDWKQMDVDEDTGFVASMRRVMANKAVMLQTFALSLLSVGLFGFIQYDGDFVQARFQIESLRNDPMTSRAVTDILRSLVVIFFVMIFRVRFSVRRSEGVKSNTASRVAGIVAIFVAIFFSILAILPCDIDDIAGLEEDSFTPPACSQECGCSAGRYGFAPVCDLDSSITYLSPCSAGCGDYENLNGFLLFQNCTCAGRAVRGSCTVRSCATSFMFYQLLFTIAVAVSAACYLMQGMVILRAVPRHDKPVAVGASFAIIGLVSALGHFLYMMISHLTCAYTGLENGACVFHHPTMWTLAVTTGGLALCSAVISLVASRFKDPSGITTFDNNS